MKGIDDILLSLIFYPLKFVESSTKNTNISKTIIYNKSSNKVLFILLQWMGRKVFYKLLISKLKKKYTLVIYSLPNKLLNENPLEVVRCFNDAKKDIEDTLDYLAKNGCSDFSIFGTSLSTALALMVANSDSRIKKTLIGLAGSHLSNSFWDSNQLLVKDLKKRMQNNGINLIKLNKYWKNLEPINNIKNIKGRKLYIHLAKNDRISPYKYGLELLDSLKQEKINFQLEVDNIFGHYLSGFKQLLFPNKIIKFLEN